MKADASDILVIFVEAVVFVDELIVFYGAMILVYAFKRVFTFAVVLVVFLAALVDAVFVYPSALT